MRAHWKMDEMTGQTLNDSSGNGNSGTLGDTTSSASDDPAWGAGKYNGGLVMDATGEFADGVTATALGFPTATNAFTISLWVKTTGSSEYYLFDNCSSCGRDVSLRMDNGRVETLIHDGTNGNGTPQYGVASSYNNGAWHYIALTWNGAGMETVYANGKRLGSTTSTSVTGSLETSAQFRIGSRNGGPSNFTGSMEEVKVYNYDLSPDEIMVDYNQGKAAVLGSLSTESDGTTTSFSSSREYCVPGSTATCTPPIGEWKLNEGTGTSAFDTSGNGSTGTLTSTPVWAAGKYGKGVKMNGTSDYINLSHPTALNATTTFTLSAWVNASSNIAGAGIIEEAFAGGGDRIQYGIGFGLDDGTDNKLQVGFYDGGGWALAEDSTAFTTGVWTHVEGTWDGTILRLYKNGIQVATNTPGRSTATDTEDIRIGARHDTAGTVDFFPGTIDEVRIFNVTRTPAEVAWDYNRGGPVAWYQFDECTGDTIYDSSGNGLSGTLVYSTGANDAAGTCTSGDTTEMRYNGRNGKFNAGMDFDGTNDYFTVADNAALDMGSQMTFTGWFNVNNTSTTRPIIAKASEYLVRFETDDNFNFFLYDGTDYEPRLTAAVAPSAGEWHHFAAVFDSTLGSNQQKLYIDGKLSAQQDRTLTIAATTNTFRNEFFGDVFDGLLDDIRVYRYPLTEAQIKLVINENSAVRFGPITGSP